MTVASGERGGADTRTPTRAIVALSFAACGSAAALRVCDPLLPRLTVQYGIGLGAAAQTVTAFTIAYAMRGSGPAIAQARNVATAIRMTRGTNHAETRSARRWI